MNEVHITGWVFRPEEKQLSTGKTLVRFSLKYGNGKDKNGKFLNAFIPVKIFTEGLNLKENDSVEVWGRIACDEWTDKQGNKRNSTYLFASRIETKQKEKSFEFGWEVKKADTPF